MDNKHQNLKDEELLLLIKQNNELAIAELLNRHKAKFFSTAFLLVKDRYVAEDIFQDACIKVITNIRNGKYTDDGRFIQWAMRITRNLAMDYLRLTKKLPKVTLPDGTDIFSILDFKEDTVESAIIKQEEYHQVYHLLNQIPYDQREVIVLRLFGNLSFKEIANLINAPINTTLGRMRYGLTNLRKLREKTGVLQ